MGPELKGRPIRMPLAVWPHFLPTRVTKRIRQGVRKSLKMRSMASVLASKENRCYPESIRGFNSILS
jgi:hypothetical protein